MEFVSTLITHKNLQQVTGEVIVMTAIIIVEKQILDYLNDKRDNVSETLNH